MKKLTKIKLKEIIQDNLNTSEMGKLYGGVEPGIELMAYGCDYNVCNNNSNDGHIECTDGSCLYSTCTTGARG